MPVNTKHPQYERMAGKWKRCRDVADGQDAVHLAGEAYLPKLKDQLSEDYEAYKRRALFYNATWRTIAGLNGMLFRKPMTVEAPASVVPLLDDVTMMGVPFQIFSEGVGEEALKVGRLGVLVDYPRADTTGMTMADAQRMKLRPCMQMYTAESIINWRVERVNDVPRLALVVLCETEMVQEDAFKQKAETRYRVLSLEDGAYTVSVYKVELDKDVLLEGPFVPLMNGRPLDYIPFAFIGADDCTPEVDEPPLIDLVNVNLSHYRTTADLEHGAHFTGLPTAWIAGHTPATDAAGNAEKLYIGSAAAWIFKDPTAKAEYLEFKGEGLGALEKLLDRKERQMAILGARMLEQQKKAAETAESQSIFRKGEESALAATSQVVSLGLTRVLEWFSAWAGAAGECKAELNRDFFPQPMTAPMLTALVSAWQMGAMSDQTLFENLQRGEVVRQGKTLEEEQKEIQESAPKLAPQPGADEETEEDPDNPGERRPKQKATE